MPTIKLLNISYRIFYYIGYSDDYLVNYNLDSRRTYQYLYVIFMNNHA